MEGMRSASVERFYSENMRQKLQVDGWRFLRESEAQTSIWRDLGWGGVNKDSVVGTTIAKARGSQAGGT